MFDEWEVGLSQNLLTYCDSSGDEEGQEVISVGVTEITWTLMVFIMFTRKIRSKEVRRV